MSFHLSGGLQKRAVGFSAAQDQRYRRTAVGYPVTLYNTLNESLVSVFIHGNTGGVGDHDSATQTYRIPVSASSSLPNLFDGVWRQGNNVSLVTNNRLCNKNAVYVESGKKYTIKQRSEKGFATSMICYSGRNADGTYNNADKITESVGVSDRVYSFIPDQDMYLCFLALGTTASGNIYLSNNDIKLMVIEGEYTSEQLEKAAINEYNNVIVPAKLYTLYSDSPILYDDVLRVYPRRQQAYRDITDVSAVQDWTQDFTLSEAETLIVTADTIVEPDDIGIVYWSRKKE